MLLVGNDWVEVEDEDVEYRDVDTLWLSSTESDMDLLGWVNQLTTRNGTPIGSTQSHQIPQRECSVRRVTPCATS